MREKNTNDRLRHGILFKNFFFDTANQLPRIWGVILDSLTIIWSKTLLRGGKNKNINNIRWWGRKGQHGKWWRGAWGQPNASRGEVRSLHVRITLYVYCILLREKESSNGISLPLYIGPLSIYRYLKRRLQG